MNEEITGGESSEWPFVLRNNHGSVKIYKCLNSRNYVTYLLAYYLHGRRVRKGFSSPELAKREARVIAKSLSTGWGSLVKVPLDRYKNLLESESQLRNIQNLIANFKGKHG